MRQFKDSGEKIYDIDLSIGNVMRVKAASSGRFNLFEPQSQVDGATLLEAIDDLPTFWELLTYLVAPDDPAAFGKAMAGRCLIAAHAAFLEEWRDFFHQLQQPQHAAVLEKTVKYRAIALELTEAKLAQMLPGLDEQVTAKMEAAASDWLGSSRDKLASILGPSPSATSG